MSALVDATTCVVIPNWNGLENLVECLDSLSKQTRLPQIIVVDNGSVDGSVEFIESKYPEIILIKHSKNIGFAGGVNSGFNMAIEQGFDYVATFNNDAVAHPNWLDELVQYVSKNTDVGIACCKLMNSNGAFLDSTGENFSVWGLTYPRGRNNTDTSKYDSQTVVFGASGGASLYRVGMLKEIGVFDEDFFAYYEDVDLSFRAQLAGWKVSYVPKAIAYHKIGATSGKIKGFTVYQTMKNLPLLTFKNVPSKYLFRVGARLTLAISLFFLRAISRGQGWPALRGSLKGSFLLMKKIKERRKIQKSTVVSAEHIWSLMTHDLPPDALALRKLRSTCWKLLRKRDA